MNIYAKEGDKVIVTEERIENGYNGDKENAKEYLEVGKIYTIDYTDVDEWSTAVNLIELPEQCFNSAHFEDYDENVKVELEVKLGSEDYLRSRGWDDKSPVVGGILFKSFAVLLDEYVSYLNN